MKNNTAIDSLPTIRNSITQETEASKLHAANHVTDQVPHASTPVGQSQNNISTQQIVTPKPSNPSSGASTTKVGKGLLEQLRNKNKEALNTPIQILPVTQEMIDECKEIFLNALSADGKDLVRTQIMASNCTLMSSDTINCECFNMLQQNTVNSVKEEFAKYFINKTNNPRIKVTTTLNEPEGKDDNKVLTKNEIFEELARQHPQLHTLRATLGLAVMSTFPYEPAAEILEAVKDNTTQQAASLDDELLENDSLDD